MQSLLFSICVANGVAKRRMIIIENNVTEKRIIEVVKITFFALVLLDISLDITVGSDNCVIFIKNTILGFISIYSPIASIPTILVVVTFAIVATIFTMTLILISETRECRSVLFFKFITLSYWK